MCKSIDAGPLSTPYSTRSGATPLCDRFRKRVPDVRCCYAPRASRSDIVSAQAKAGMADGVNATPTVTIDVT